MRYNLTYKPFGDKAILIEWPKKIDPNILSDLISHKKTILDNNIKEIVEIINAYNSLTVKYLSTINNIYDEISRLKVLYSTKNKSEEQQNFKWEIPVCYHPEFGVDLRDLCGKRKLSEPEIIALHSQVVYTVYFIGFIPGFLYLGGLPKKLHTDRKADPALRVPKGAVAIGGGQTGVYPAESPGGWHVIGNTPVHFFDVDNDPPCFAKPGDQIVFKAVSRKEYSEVAVAVKNGGYSLVKHGI